MSWYRHYLLWMTGGAGVGYLVGTQKKMKLKHEELITTAGGALTGLVVNKVFNHFVPEVKTAPAQIPSSTQPKQNTGSSIADYESEEDGTTTVEQAPPIPYDTPDDIQGASISDGGLLDWDEEDEEDLE